MFSRRYKKEPGIAVFPARISRFSRRSAITALDLEGDILRVVQASGAGPSTKITRISSARLDLSPEKREQAGALGAAIRKALRDMRVKCKEVVFCLPRGQVVLRPLIVPSVEDVRELASVVNFQIAKDLPFRLEEAIVDFKLLRVLTPPPITADDANTEQSGPGAQHRLELLVGAVRSNIAEFYRSVAKAAGLKLVGLGLRSVSAAVCIARRKSESREATLLITVRKDETTFDVVAEDKLAFSRVLSVSSTAAEGERAQFLHALEIEAVRSLHGYEGSTGQVPIRRLLVAGSTGAEAAVAESLGKRFGLPGVLFDPASVVEIKNADRVEAQAAIGSVGLALAALSPAGLAIDFANPKKPAVRRNTRRTQILLGSAAAIMVLFALVGTRANLVKKRLKAREEVQLQLADAEKKLPIYRRLKSQSKVVNTWVTDEQNWLDHLAYISGILPGADQIYVSAFSTTPQHLIRFSVQSKTGELLAELDKKLRAAGYEVRPLSITPANDKHGYNFRTTVELSIPKKMKPDLSKIKPPPRPPDDQPRKSAGVNGGAASQAS